MYKRIGVWLVVLIYASLLIGCTPRNIDDNKNNNKPSPVQPVPSPSPSPEPKPIEKDPIAEQIKTMTLDEKIGQMIIAGIDGYEMNENEKGLIQNYHIGGFILFGRNIESPEQLLALNNSLRSANSQSKIPLILSVDEEGGRISRIPKVIKNLPANKAIGKINNKKFSYEIGLLLAEKVKAFGFNMDFAPVLDINSNPKNPVIGDRAFGSASEVVTDLGVQTMMGIKAGGAVPVIKHFPGHGDTSVDSHVGLPTVEHDLERLKSFELIPFEAAINNGAGCVMVAHILLPQIDAENPASLSSIMITDILRKQLNFEGVVITDDMTMAAITKNYDLAAAAIQAVKAGNDIILVAHKYENALFTFHTLNKAVLDGIIEEERIDQSVYRILKLKQDYHLQDDTVQRADIEKLNNKITDTLDKYMRNN
ncbi:MAG: putative anhydromuramoyl-peptide exo-beta-N-acetylglucosaminidase [Clostridia bacterium]|jgi:beta-N-acetylhexosaminidase|nr:putative anhydromuramoyl-peptide exo-beta-N-acetylglucosaminidase [Clostridia bacterium]